jgi:predicted TPR repeat methyltransferase
MPTLAIKPGIVLSPVESGYVAYDPATDTLHQLNPFAALLTELCDGRRTADQIRELAGPLLPEDRAREIDQWIATALQVGLLIPDSGATDAREFSAAELYSLVQRLKDYGKMQTAYICAKRVVELDPQDWDAWYLLADLCQYVGKRDEARDAYQKYFSAHPEDFEIEHLLLALKDEAPPERASDRTIQHIYKGFAKTFDGRLVDDLKYQGPERLLELITAVLGNRGDLAILDLGCGSGLAGARLKPLASTLSGIDLSPEMLELARQRAIYDRLEVAEITAWLESGSEQFDLITSCDCLIYFGDLTRIAAAAGRRLKPNGVFAFTLERGPQFPFRLTDTGRYEHHPDHIRQVAAATGLTVAGLTAAFLRYEYTVEVIGLLAALRRTA